MFGHFLPPLEVLHVHHLGHGNFHAVPDQFLEVTDAVKQIDGAARKVVLMRCSESRMNETLDFGKVAAIHRLLFRYRREQPRIAGQTGNIHVAPHKVCYLLLSCWYQGISR